MFTSPKSSSKRPYHFHKTSWKDFVSRHCPPQKNRSFLSHRKKQQLRVPFIACSRTRQIKENSWTDFNSSGTPPNYPRSYRKSTTQRLECTQNYCSLIISIETDVLSWTTATSTLVAANLRAICAMRTSRTIRAATQSPHPIRSSIWDGGIQMLTPMLQLVERNRRKSC